MRQDAKPEAITKHRPDTRRNNMDAKRHMRNILKRKGIKEYNEAVGGLGLPSKMPGYAYGISAELCRTGGCLRKRPLSVCEGCYATRNNYTYPSVKASHAKRLESMSNLDAWADNMIKLLKALAPLVPQEERYFRWHDSGDLQGTEHLHAILRVAIWSPEWKFWLPTKEYGIVRKVKKQVPIPRNIVVRLSMPFLYEVPSDAIVNIGEPTSTVSSRVGHRCPARYQKNACGTCRACWESSVKNVDYARH